MKSTIVFITFTIKVMITESDFTETSINLSDYHNQNFFNLLFDYFKVIMFTISSTYLKAYLCKIEPYHITWLLGIWETRLILMFANMRLFLSNTSR